MAHHAPVDHTRRFSSRAAYYDAYRPGYPDAVVECLSREAGLTPADRIVDVGSGTGLSAELFLRHGHDVCGVEPNGEMRAAAEARLRDYPRFRSVDGRAEQTSLPDASADAVVCASAFHWFDAAAARAEFSRILRKDGLVVVMSNGRRKDSSPFMRAYAEIIRTYQEHTPAHVGKDERVRAFLGRDDIATTRIDYEEPLDFVALAGRTLSYSTMPLPQQPGHDEMMRDLRRLFDESAVNGVVRHDGQITLYWAR